MWILALCRHILEGLVIIILSIPELSQVSLELSSLASSFDFVHFQLSSPLSPCFCLFFLSSVLALAKDYTSVCCIKTWCSLHWRKRFLFQMGEILYTVSSQWRNTREFFLGWLLNSEKHHKNIQCLDQCHQDDQCKTCGFMLGFSHSETRASYVTSRLRHMLDFSQQQTTVEHRQTKPHPSHH